MKDYKTMKKRLHMYPNMVITVAIFYTLPVVQLVLQYQMKLDDTGNEDLCYYNYLCLRKLGILTAFNNIFSNIGYCILGILFFIIVYRRDKTYTEPKNRYEEKRKVDIIRILHLEKRHPYGSLFVYSSLTI